MFGIKLVDIGSDGCVAEIKSSVETLAEAEIIARETICKALGTDDIELAYDDDLIYEVWCRGESIGVVAIKVL